MAAWILIELGQSDLGLAPFVYLLINHLENEPVLHNVIDWVGEPAFPLVKKYLDNGGSREGRYGISIMARIAQVEDL